MGLLIQSEDKEYLYSILYFDQNKIMTQANFHAHNMKEAFKKGRKYFSHFDIIAIGLVVGGFENKNGIFV